MEHNVGKVDQIIRLSLALIFVVLYYLNIAGGMYNTYFLVALVLLFFTSVRKCCPVYALLGFGTCKVESNGEKPVIKTKKVTLK
jgi:hypothetical protein